MNKVKTVFVGSMVALVLLVPGVLASTTQHAGGGVWTHGFSNGQVFSNYYHKSKYHASSVYGTQYISSGKTKKGVTAKASDTKAWYGNKAFYKVY